MNLRLQLASFLKPQLGVVLVAVMFLFGWLMGEIGTASHGRKNKMPRIEPMARVAVSLPPETGILLSPKPLTFSVDCSLKPCMALTFDDGPDANMTPKIVEALEKAGAKATFFVIGNRIDGNEELLRRMHANGFEIANHSWSHADFTRLNPEQIKTQIESTQNALRYARIPDARFFRAPYGRYNEAVQQAVPLPIVLWNIDPKDWEQTETDGLIHAIRQTARPGGIVVMHDTEEITAEAITEIIDELGKYYQLVTLSEMLSLPIDANGNTVVY